ncbi:B12-binding domain-containing protein [Alkalibaculum bacchi]|mgnify:FL=1|uniref:B12-binding domain-containing protein n=1 Tax=Alkalibaculum bacchi TaxID=645887 RepID=UPI0026ED7FA7|nr:B12-binding domain-containing protein [Alkalibaculum bacchi]
MDYDQLSIALSELKGDEVLELTKQFIDSRPDELAEKRFIIAAQDGINKVSERFEMRDYKVGDLIYAKEILEQIMDMILPAAEGSI